MSTQYLVGPTRTYTTITAAVNAIPSNISGTGIHEVIIDAATYNQFPAININKTGGSSIDYIHIHAAVGSEHHGSITSGVRITTAVLAGPFFIGTNFTRVSNLIISNTGGTAAGQTNCMVISGSNCLITNIIFRASQGSDPNTGQPSYGMFCNGNNCTFICCLCIPINSTPGRTAYFGWTGSTFYNCGAYNFSACYVFAGPSTTCNNCWAFTTQNSCFTGPAQIASNNASNDNSAPGVNSLKSQTIGMYGFVNSSVDNYHIKVTSVLNGAGINLSSIFTADIDLDLITTWSIGPDCIPPPSAILNTSSQPWQNNNEPHTKQTDAKPPALKTLVPEPVQGLGKPSKTKEAHNPTLQKQGPEQAPKANTSSFKTNEASASGLQAKKGYIHGFLSIMAETNGYPDSSSRLTGNMVYLLSDGLVTGKAYTNRDNVRPTRAVLQRAVLPVEPYGNFVHELRSNDSLALFQSHFQNRIGTTTGAGTTFYEFTPSKSRVNLGGSSFGTGSYVHGTKQAFCVSVFKAMNGTGYHFKSGVCDSLRFRFDPRDTVQVESDFRFATVSMLATSVGYPFGSFSTLPNFPGHKCDINFFGLPLTGFTFECNNNLVKTSPVGTNTRYYKFGQYQVSGVASVDIPPQLFQYYATMLADTSFPVYGTLLNSAKDKIVFQMDNCKIKPFEYNLSDSQIQIPFTAYESEDGSSPPIRIKVWTQNYSATTFQPN